MAQLNSLNYEQEEGGAGIKLLAQPVAEQIHSVPLPPSAAPLPARHSAAEERVSGLWLPRWLTPAVGPLTALRVKRPHS